jgi:hypothetical protein
MTEKTGRSQDASDARQRYDSLNREYAKLDSRCQYQSGVADTLQKQNRDQQNTINRCQEDAIKRIVPEPERHYVAEILPIKSKLRQPIKTYIFTTNKPITPAVILVSCDRPIDDVTGVLAGTMTVTATAPVKLSEFPNIWTFSISSPEWTTETPVVIQFSYAGNEEPKCTFARR